MLITISEGKRLICKALFLDRVMEHIKEEIGELKENEEMDLHIWREED